MPRPIALIASVITTPDRASAFRDLIQSIEAQSVAPKRIVVGLYCDPMLITIVNIPTAWTVVWLRKPLPQFAIYQQLLATHEIDDDEWIMFSDDDDVWGVPRTEIVSHFLTEAANIPNPVAVVADSYHCASVKLSDNLWERKHQFINKECVRRTTYGDQKKIIHIEYWQIVCRAKYIREFASVYPSLVYMRFADVFFRTWVICLLPLIFVSSPDDVCLYMYRVHDSGMATNHSHTALPGIMPSKEMKDLLFTKNTCQMLQEAGTDAEIFYNSIVSNATLVIAHAPRLQGEEWARYISTRIFGCTTSSSPCYLYRLLISTFVAVRASSLPGIFGISAKRLNNILSPLVDEAKQKRKIAS